MTSTDIPALPISRDQSLSSQKQPLDGKELELIPQISGTCWFNAALTVILYSQMVRNVFYKEALKWLSNLEELEKNKFKRFLLFMLKYNYTEPKKIAELFKGRIKPEFLLFSYLKNTDNQQKIKKTKEKLSQSITNFGCVDANFEFFNILKALFSKKTDITNFYYVEGNSYISKNFSPEGLSAKVILFYHDKFKYLGQYVNELFGNDLHKIDKHAVTGVDTYEEEITIFGRTYKLDACILGNYNMQQTNHVICGITYNNNAYVYNGWINYLDNLDLSSYKQKTKKSNCPLFSRDWKSDLRKPDNTAGFCLPDNIPNCTDLLPIDERNLCFDFSTTEYDSEKMLVYVLKEDEEETVLDLKSLLSIKKLVYTSQSISPLIREFYGLEDKTVDELKNLLEKIYTKIQINLLYNFLQLFKVFYFLLTGEQLPDELTESDKPIYLKKLYIAILKVYIKDYKLFKITLMEDAFIYKFLTEEQINELQKKGFSFLEAKKTEELEEEVKQMYGNDKINELKENPHLFRITYFLITNKRLTNELIVIKKEEVLRDFFIGLIKKKEKKLNKDTDLIKALTSKELNEILNKIGYLNTNIKFAGYSCLLFLIFNEIFEYKIPERLYLQRELILKLFLFALIKFFILKGIIVNLDEFSEFGESSFIRKLLKLPIKKLKNIVDFTKLPFTYKKIKTGDSDRIVEEYLKNTLLEDVYRKFIEIDLSETKGILILLIISQNTYSTFAALLNSLSGSSSSSGSSGSNSSSGSSGSSSSNGSSSRGGFFNYNNDNHKIVRKQLKIY